MDNVPRNWKALTSTGKNCLGDDDVDFSAPLHIAFDSNAAISSAVVAQKDGHTMKVIRSFFVKTPLKLQELVRQIADHYRPMYSHEIIFYYDSTFVWETGSSSESYADIIIRIFEENSYQIEPVFVGQPPRHDWKHECIDLSLKGAPQYLQIRLNIMTNEFLKIAMKQTGIRQGRNGFEKDKKPESTPDSEDAPDEYKTHITDAFDTLWYGMNFYLREKPSDSNSMIFIGKK